MQLGESMEGQRLTTGVVGRFVGVGVGVLGALGPRLLAAGHGAGGLAGGLSEGGRGGTVSESATRLSLSPPPPAPLALPPTRPLQRQPSPLFHPL